MRKRHDRRHGRLACAENGGPVQRSSGRSWWSRSSPPRRYPDVPRMAAHVAAAILSLVLCSACAAAVPRGGAATTTAVPSLTPTEVVPAQVVSFPSQDGVTLGGVLYGGGSQSNGAGAHATILSNE